MKRKTFLFIILVLLGLNSCLIKSLHPFFKESDLLFRENFEGAWLDEDSTIWKIERYKRSKGFLKGDTLLNSYLINMTEDNGDRSIFVGSLFQLNDVYYLDFFPVMDDELCEGEFHFLHLLPTHSLAKVDFISSNNVKISWFNEEWLTELFEQNKIKISHEKVKINEKDEGYVLTASTDELQKFIVKYGDSPDIYQCDNEGVCVTLGKIE